MPTLPLEAVGGRRDRTKAWALFALVTYAWIDPSARADVAAVVARRLAQVAAADPQAGTGISWSVAQLALATPDMDPATRRFAGAVVRAEENYTVPLLPRQRRRPGQRLLRALRIIR